MLIPTLPQVGDGTTSVIVLAGELLKVAEPFLDEGMHPTVIISAFRQALEDLVNVSLFIPFIFSCIFQIWFGYESVFFFIRIVALEN